MATRQSQVIITANGKAAEIALQAIDQKVKQLEQDEKRLKQTLDALRRANKADTDEFKAKQETLRQTANELKNLRGALDQGRSGMEQVDKAVKNLANSTTRQLRDALRAGKKELEHMAATNKDLGPLKQKLQQIERQIQKNTGAVKAHGSAWQIAVKNITAYVGVFGAFNMLKNKLEEITRLSLKFSDQLADVRKVSGLEMEDINQLAINLSKIDTRTSLSTLVGNLAYSGAKLGFGSMGIEGLESYVKAANQVNVALGEELGEQAMPALSKITENMGLIKEMGVEKAMLATGSAIFKLASTSTASAGPIVEFSKRLLSLGKNAGLTTPQILALASASDSFAQMPEVASTAIGKLIVAMQTNHNLIEQSLGMAKGTISDLYQEGKMMDALLLVFEKMKEKGGINALGPIFKTLGSNGQRLKNVLVTLSEQLPTLKTHLETSTTAFEEATAVTAEYNIQQNTAAGIMQRANNMWEKAFVNPDGVNMVKEMAQAWYDMTKSLTQSQSYMTSMHVALKAIFLLFEGFIRLAPSIAIFALVKGLMKLVVALGLTKVGADGLTASLGRMSAAMKANWIALAISLVVQLGISLYDSKVKSEEAAKAMDVFAQAEDEAAKSSAKERSELDRLYKTTQDTTKSLKQRTEAVQEMQRKYPAYFGNLTTEEILAGKAADAYSRLKTEILNAAKARAYQKKIEELAEQNVNLEDEIDKKQQWLDENAEEYRKQKQKANKPTSAAEWATPGAQATNWNERRGFTSAYEKEQEIVTKINNQIAKNDATIDKLADKVQEYQPSQKTEPVVFNPLTNEAVDKEALAAAKKAALEEKKELRQQLAESEQEAKAIVDNIKNFYERQITEVINIATQTGMNKELQDQMVNDITMRMNMALAQARKAVVGTENDWNEFKMTIQADMIEPLVDGTNESMQLLDKIENNNLNALRAKIAILSKSLNKPEGALLDQVWKNATMNEKAIAQIENKQEQRRRQAILENDYTGKVNDDFQTTMEQFGFAVLTPSQMAQIEKGGDDAKRFLDERTREWQLMFQGARENMQEIMMADVSTESGRRGVFDMLFGDDWQNDAATAALNLEGILQLAQDDFELFMQKIIEYNDAYAEAQKKAYDRTKKIQDNIFNNRTDILGIDDAVSAIAAYTKKQEREGGQIRTIAQRMGFADLDNDPELVRLQLLEQRQWEYFMQMRKLREQDKISEDQLQAAKEKYEAAENARLDRYAERMKERAQLLEQTVKPVEEFGKALGDALSKGDAEERSEAIKEAVKSMATSISEQTAAMVREWMLQLVKKKLYAKLMAQEELKSQRNITAITTEEGETRLDATNIIESGIAAITQQAAQQITATKQSQAATNMATTAAETEGNVAAGIASGAAKTIGQLGWWGIPLVAVITALLNGLLAFAIGKLFGAKKSSTEDVSSSSATKLKLVSGMLTYDSGNVRNVLGNDGRVYMARDEGTVSTGIVRRPITAMVNGQPSLIGERGPELVVGRETTKAIMLSRPDILRTIIDIDRHRSGRFRTLDTGDLSAAAQANDPNSSNGMDMLSTINALANTVSMLSSTVADLQRKGIPAHINKYGAGGLIDEVQSGLKFVRKYQ